ncbi:S9 family peptidase [Flagellimonas sp. S3867]|uniref:alpha/beta hydrolase family protein n=1 Tax=Flagellimonas sp. S3867 TaxID=2768063 RepID=UPI0016849191|nr:prolyl oligopeptidase family serine peptidase [Flagellimonas sp. S3867]
MKIKVLFALCFNLFLSFSLFAQNGELYHKEKVVLHDTIKQKIANRPVIQKTVDATQLYSIIYESDGLKIKGYLATPKTEGVYPVIIFNRGGNREFGALNDLRATYILQTIASWGYVVAASNYRGGGGSEGMEEFGGKDVNDVHNLVPMLANMKGADTTRMGIYGWSRGGLMTYRVLSETCKFKAAIIGAGVANSFRNIEARPEMEKYVFSQLLPNYETNKEAELKKRSAVYWVDKLCRTTPILLLHGSGDWRVSPKDALDMADSLYAKKHPFRLHFYEGGDHGLSEYRSLTDNNIKEFLDHYVKNLKTHPHMKPHGR